jgi:alcohol dehydrogenase (cytochrome c)
MWRWYVTDAYHWFGPSLRLRLDKRKFADLRTSARLRTRFADSWKRGGGGIWTTPAIDDSRNYIYVVTGNPWPDFDGSRRPGDNLYTDCIVALDASSGRLKWYFQETPHDEQDLDSASPPVLFDTVDSAGHTVAAVGEAGKTGIFYVLNRDSGRLLRRTRSVASFGAPAPATKVWEGGTSWSPISFDPRLGYVVVSAAQHLGRASRLSLDQHAWATGYGTVSAVKVSTGEVVWQDKFDQGIVGGSASTAGGLTFVGEGSGYFDALDTESGVRLWHFKIGPGVNAPPAVFSENGKEYVAVAAGGNQQFGTKYGDEFITFRLTERR